MLSRNALHVYYLFYAVEHSGLAFAALRLQSYYKYLKYTRISARKRKYICVLCCKALLFAQLCRCNFEVGRLSRVGVLEVTTNI